jgi:endonuclease/exonuclease/phosphatase family metal-dependent hydrolase
VKIGWLLNILAVLLLIATYLSVYIPPDVCWISFFFGLIYPYLLWINLFFVVGWLILKPRYLFLSLVTVVAGWSFLIRYIQWDNKTSDKPGIDVISYNVNYFEKQGSGISQQTADSIIAFLEERSPDIVCLQEVRLRSPRIFDLPALIRRFAFAEHYQYARTAHSGGMVTITRYPVVGMEEIRFAHSGNMALATDVVAAEDTLRILNVHLQSFRIDPEDYSILSSPDLTESSDRQEIKKVSGKLKRASQMRALQARMIREYIDKSPFPVLVCGDFNDTPFSYTYRKVKGKLKDAYVESGKGIGHTYIGTLPSFRIDFILHGDYFESCNYTQGTMDFSDHRPVSCRLLKN